MIAIHHNQIGYRKHWVDYCEKNQVPYRLVDCYDDNIIEQLRDCEALMWHFNPNNVQDFLVAKQILFSLDHVNFPVFPDWRTAWHFEDKVAQKYLLEAAGAPLVPSYVFLDREKALAWAAETEFPKVCKLRAGSASFNVWLVETQREAERIINRAFRGGIKQYEPWGNLKERWRQYRIGKTDWRDVLRGVARLALAPRYARVAGPARDYVYFQDFLPDNDSDIRVVTVYGKAVSKRRMVRPNDFRASGSGIQTHKKAAIDERCVEIALRTNRRLGIDVLNYDFIYDTTGAPRIVEISYGTTTYSFPKYPGYWDEQLNWHAGPCDICGWMVEGLLAQLRQRRSGTVATPRTTLS